MATESEIPISELKADEAYLRFIACRSPDDRVYNLAYERLWELLYGRAKQHAWNKVGGKTKRNQKHENLVEDAVLQAFAKIVRQQHKDTYQRDPSKTIDGVWSHKGNSERKVAAFSSWFFGIVGNNVIDALRKTGRFPVPGSTFDIAGEEGEGGDFIEQVVDERTESASVRGTLKVSGHTKGVRNRFQQKSRIRFLTPLIHLR